MTETNSTETAAVEAPMLPEATSAPVAPESYVETWRGVAFKVTFSTAHADGWHFTSTQIYPESTPYGQRNSDLESSGIREDREGESKWFLGLRNYYSYGPTFQVSMDLALKRAARKSMETIALAEKYEISFSSEEDGE